MGMNDFCQALYLFWLPLTSHKRLNCSQEWNCTSHFYQLIVKKKMEREYYGETLNNLPEMKSLL